MRFAFWFLLIVVVACGDRATLAQQRSESSTTGDTRTITVSAYGEVKVPPDEILVSLMVHTKDPALLVAKQKNDAITKKVMALRKAYGIEPIEFEITSLEVEPS